MVNSEIPVSDLFKILPTSLREELLVAFNEIVTNYRERRWEPSELNGGKLCEITYTIIKGYVDNSYPATSSKPSNMVDACRSLEQASFTIPRSVKIQIPRMLIALYEIRNNRGVGHAGGDINPNEMDATCVLYMSKWLVAELVRIYHNIDTETAESVVESIIERVSPVVWKVGDKLRVLDTTIKMKEKTLLLLHQTSTPVQEQILVDWIEHSNPSAYRRDVLRPLHQDKLIEYDTETHLIHLSPKGVLYLENDILPKIKKIA
jgi:hypothetical protein